ncbi:FkbM family methyltransferase [Desulfobotulus mexicanus]|uniref:FkbM family methyltransferase n=1 Tax=Desulfobotulus mexicanus TaxID=2586642 RepID=A0A5Q4VCL6_9BACT|nr:FkbM family methyltransferase [Desulfobotulus mexicanus]TYT75305.1 FkbM family methyltransferase [Desulfobotulus mexicanus]
MHDIKVLSETQRMVKGRHGYFVYNLHDHYIGKSLELYGEYCEHEVSLFSKLIEPGSCVWDVGANIGALTVPLAHLVGESGRIVAFEPQPVIFNNLAANVSINGLNNVRCLPFALADRSQELVVKVQNYHAPGNFGAVSLVNSKKSLPDADAVRVEAKSLSDLNYLPKPAFIKIDVEGMEAAVISGLRKLISVTPPLLYVENDRVEYSAELIELLWELGYSLYWHITPYYNDKNYFGIKYNLWPGISSFNMICVHSTHSHININAEKISDSKKHPLQKKI